MKKEHEFCGLFPYFVFIFASYCMHPYPSIQPSFMEKIWFIFLVPVYLIVHYFLPCCLAITMTQTNLTTDQSALLALKSHLTFGSNNVFLASNWSIPTSNTTSCCCSWIGVTCGVRHQRVTALNLGNLGLVGTIPPHLANLSFLASLNLRNNSFHGPLPDNLALLPRLKFINFALNKFSGTIPPSLGNISKLEFLHISGNQLHGSIPKEIGSLTMLKNLSVYNNHLSGSVPSSIYNMSSLHTLYLGINSFSGSLPTDMCSNLPELEVLNLEGNEFHGQIPSTISKCRRLQYLFLPNNKFTGSIPREVGNLTMLAIFYLINNNLKGAIPQELGNLHNLQEMNLGSNALSGLIPSKLFNISKLEIIGLTENQLWGKLPSGIGITLPNLKGLYLAGNNLSGIIPNSIFNASKLTMFDLSSNSFTGFIPDTIHNLRLLEWFNVEHNSLVTESSSLDIKFLTSLTNCRNLRYLGISGNSWNGILPISIGNLSTSLEEFHASGCNIKGNIPKEIGNLSNLITLSLGGNEMTGAIPPTIGRLEKLQALDLSGDKLQGSVPYDLCHMRHLFKLDLSGNELSEPVMACIGNLTSLRELYLNSNKFSSSIPSALWSLTEILRLNLSSNSISGSLPLGIENLKVVTYIDVSKNHLSGNVPSSIGSLQSLAYLSIAHNTLQGQIPESFKDLISLELLDLSHNKLSGIIPKSLEKLTNLKTLNVSVNSLWGEIPNGGPFANFSAQSFLMNSALCGAPQLQVPPCKNFTRGRSRKIIELLLIYALPTTVVIVFVLIFLLIRCRKRKVKITAQTDLSHEKWRRISHHELIQATEGFSESNLLGNGSYGSVYKGVLSNGVTIAVKVFNLELEGAFKSFDVECEVLCNIRHRNLVKVISSCSNNLDFTALVLEYMPNGSLEKWLYSHNYFLDILQRLNIMIDVAFALEYLHHGYSTPIVHCDLKPSNILLDEEMVAHVGDFGISKLLGEGEFMKQTITLATVGYMAPEYGAEGIVSTRGDVYSYGIMLMETFTRKKPTDEAFTGEMDLKRWVSDSLHGSITEVVDSNLLGREDEHFIAKEQCVLAALGLALKCTADLPDDRINMEDVVVELVKIKNIFLAHIGRT